MVGIALAALAAGPIELALAGIWTGFVVGLSAFAAADDRRRPAGLWAGGAYFLGGMLVSGLAWAAVGLLPAIPLHNPPGLALLHRVAGLSPYPQLTPTPTPAPALAGQATLNIVYYLRGVAVGLAATFYPELAGAVPRRGRS